jgi:hypothetical protein
VAHNTAGGNFGTGGGLYFGNAQNSIIYGNNAAGFANNYSSPMTYCDTTPANAGLGNISTDPQLLDDFHIAITSPCRGAGNAFYTTESDIDSEAWTNPPSMGCDEPWPAGLVGPLSVSLAASDTKVYANHSLALAGHITGRASRVAWDFGDGTTSTNLSSTVTHAWQSTGPFNVVFAAYNSDNSGGVSANLWLNVIPVLQPQLTPEPMTTNGFQFQFYAQSNLSYRIQRATNLVPPIAWQLMQFAFTNADGLIVLKDSTLSNGSQFYRVIVQ